MRHPHSFQGDAIHPKNVPNAREKKKVRERERKNGIRGRGERENEQLQGAGEKDTRAKPRGKFLVLRWWVRQFAHGYGEMKGGEVVAAGVKGGRVERGEGGAWVYFRDVNGGGGYVDERGRGRGRKGRRKRGGGGSVNKAGR